MSGARPSDPLVEVTQRLGELTAGMTGQVERTIHLENTVGQLGALLQQLQDGMERSGPGCPNSRG